MERRDSAATAAIATPQVEHDAVLVVDGDSEFLGSMRATFHLRGLRVLAMSSGAEAMRQIRQGAAQSLALAVIDVTLPDYDGLQLGQDLLKHVPTLSLIFVSQCSQIETKVRALLLGADDYITKPCEWAELVARVERSLRRRHELRMVCLRHGNLEIDLARGRVRVHGQDVSLSMHEYRFLCCLAQSQGQVVSCVEIAEQLWPNGVSGTEEEIVKKVKLRLETKLDRFARGTKFIHNVPRIGYYLEQRVPAYESIPVYKGA